MNIDWFTFVAQITNFLVLVGLLRWFLYGPIVRAMNRREEKIAGRLETADRQRSEADDRIRQYEQKIRDIDNRREEMLEEARGEAQEERERWMKETREAVERKRNEWLEAVQRQREDLLDQLRRDSGRLAVRAARRTLAQLADVSLEEQMVSVFTSRLQELDDKKQKEIAGHLANGEGEVTVHSAFALSGERQAKLRQAVRDKLAYDAEIAFESSPEMICGLELDAAGYRFGWNVNEFLRDMELDFGGQRQ